MNRCQKGNDVPSSEFVEFEVLCKWKQTLFINLTSITPPFYTVVLNNRERNSLNRRSDKAVS